MSNRPLSIVNDQDEIIGEEASEKIHREGLLHRIVHIWFYNKRGGVIFQHRSPTKKPFPNLLDVSVGGHVELGETYEQAVIREMEEEAGLIVSTRDLVLIKKWRLKTTDPATNTTPDHIIKTFAYRFDGSIDQLRVEKGEAVGFEFCPIDTILNIPDDQRTKFVPPIFDSSELEIFRAIQKLIPHLNP